MRVGESLSLDRPLPKIPSRLKQSGESLHCLEDKYDEHVKLKQAIDCGTPTATATSSPNGRTGRLLSVFPQSVARFAFHVFKLK